MQAAPGCSAEDLLRFFTVLILHSFVKEMSSQDFPQEGESKQGREVTSRLQRSAFESRRWVALLLVLNISVKL